MERVICGATGLCTIWAAALLLLVSDAAAQANTGGGLVLNEVMSGNKGGGLLSPALMAALHGGGAAMPIVSKHPDWVEIRNAGQATVSLEGWVLRTHDVNISLPALSLEPSGLLVVVAEGKAAKKAAKKGSKAQPVQASLMVGAFSGPPASSAQPNSSSTAPVLRGAFNLHGNASKLSQLALVQPDGRVSDTLGWLPPQRANVSWGYPGPGTAQPAGLPDVSGRTFLAAPTPGAPNSAAAKEGPFIVSVLQQLAAPQQPGQPISMQVQAAPNLAPIKDVSLLYKVGFGFEQVVPATLTKQASATPGTTSSVALYTASIPGSAFKAGDLIRWAAQATDTAGLTSRSPPAPAAAPQATTAAAAPQWYGTVAGGIQDPDITPNASVPVLEWFTQSPDQSVTIQGAGGSVLFYQGQLYDGVFVKRRGVSSLAWPKPKLKVLMAEGQRFVYSLDAPPVDEFGLQSHFYELGERSYMKESLGLQLLADAGVPTPTTFYMHVRLNGKFFGLFSFVESIDKTFLERNHIAVGGPLFKSENGELSNLRWDIKPSDMPNFYSLKYPRDHLNVSKGSNYQGSVEWLTLANFTRGLAGGGPVPRSAFVLENLHVPQIINLLAAQVIINNQDRCTKNFFVYDDPTTSRWYMLPWDLDGALGQDNGLGGMPGPKYCVLACEQWNSPLYCDSEHTQDLQRVTPWGTVTVKMDDPYTGAVATAGPPPAAGASGKAVQIPGAGRRALQQATYSYRQYSTPAPASNPPASSSASGPAAGAGGAAAAPAPAAAAGAAPAAAAAGAQAAATAAPAPPVAQVPAKPAIKLPSDIERLLVVPKAYPQPQGWQQPDVDLSKGASPLGAAGTYNHLVDAVTDVGPTRAMLMRRIRSLADTYLGPDGKLAQMANATYIAIRSLAIRDAQAWKTGIDIDRGLAQITKEFIPARYYLLTSVYGPNGSYPLVPGPQPAPRQDQLRITHMAPAQRNETDLGGPEDGLPHVRVSNPSPDTAMDISHWSLDGPDHTFKFAPGTVVPANSTLYVVADMPAFDNAHMGQGLLVVGPLKPRKQGDKHGKQKQAAAGNGTAQEEPAPTNMQLRDEKGSVVSQL